VKQKSLFVLLSFDVESLTDKVMLGYFSYPLQAFVTNPLCCYRCQAYRHVPAVCRREVTRCAEGHETKECVVLKGKKQYVLIVQVPMGLGIRNVQCERQVEVRVVQRVSVRC
jgi:hypothetical protein